MGAISTPALLASRSPGYRVVWAVESILTAAPYSNVALYLVARDNGRRVAGHFNCST